MPYPMPDIRNFTRPGGFALWIDTGSGFRHLGNIDLSKSSEENKTNNDIEVETQLTGEPLLADILPGRRDQTYKLALQEVTQETLQAYDMGGAVSLQNEGSAAVVDQSLILAGELPASLGKYGISAVTVRQFLDQVLSYDGAAYTDRTAEADSEAGTPFDALTTADDKLYLGKKTPFDAVYFDLAVNGEYAGLAFKYWDGGAWVALAPAGAGKDLNADGLVTALLNAAQEKKIINNSEAMYWIEISCTGVTTPATVNCIRQALTRNTDYIIDPGSTSPALLAGRIGRLASGVLADGEEVKVNYSHVTWEALIYDVLTADYLHCAARIDHLTKKGTQYRRHIPKCLIKPDGAISFDNKSGMQLPIILQTLADIANNPTRPYGWREVLY